MKYKYRYKNLLIKRARVEDAEAILALQKLAYLSEAEIYNNKSIPPLTQTLEEIRAEFDHQIFLKALIEGRIIGSVRAFQTQETCHIGRLAVHPDFQNWGIGSQPMNEIEGAFQKALNLGSIVIATNLVTTHNLLQGLPLQAALTRRLGDIAIIGFQQSADETVVE